LTGAVDDEPVASIIVVNYNGADCVEACVRSLTAGASMAIETFVVDNASTDRSIEILGQVLAAGPSFELIESASNLGYAGAVNLVLPRCRGRFVGVFNMDLEAEVDWLSPLVAHLDANPGTAAVNPLITIKNGATVNAIGLDLHVTGLGFNRALGTSRSGVGARPISIDGVQGAAFLCRRAVLDEMGGLDDSGFLYHEDVHLSWALRSMGHTLQCIPSSVVRHDYFLSMHPEKLFLLERNRLALLATALSGPTRLLLSPMLLLTECMLWGYALLRGPRFLAAKARTYGAHWRSRGARSQRRLAWRGRQQVSDLKLLHGMRWGFAWRQFATLAGQRGNPRRPFDASERRSD
jgi:GT2 family glycosyltransferase